MMHSCLAGRTLLYAILQLAWINDVFNRFQKVSSYNGNFTYKYSVLNRILDVVRALWDTTV